MESIQKGSWDKFLKEENVISNHGWNLRHTTVAGAEVPYDSLQVFNSNVFVSYLIKDEVVDYILLGVIGDIPVKETAPSIYDLNNFDYYIMGEKIANMSGEDWVNLLGNSFRENFVSFFEMPVESADKTTQWSESRTVMSGYEMVLSCYKNSMGNGMDLTMNPASKLKGEATDSGKPNRIF